MNTVLRRFWFLLVAAGLSLPTFCPAAQKSYGSGTLIIPMDLTFQDFEMFKAYGLAYALLAKGVPVDWVIQTGKNYRDVDFTASFRNIQTGSTNTWSYSGGPFVIDAQHRNLALPIIQSWHSNHNVVVHEATAAFTANVGRALIAAPRIAILGDLNEAIMFSYLNSASIPDSEGKQWASNSVDLLGIEAIAGSTSINDRDGALFDTNGVPRFSSLFSAHYSTVAPDADAIAEIGEFLRAKTLLFGECQSVRTFENNGYFLTDQGLTNTGRPNSSTLTFAHADHPIAQDVGPFGTVGGSDSSFVPIGQYLGTQGVDLFRILRGTVSATTVDIAVFGHAYQDTNAGKVFYLGGHQYSTTLPLSANPTSDGVRYVLNSVFLSPAATLGDGAADLLSSLSGTSTFTTNRELQFSITYQNVGLGPAYDAGVVVGIPPGATASAIVGTGTNVGNQIVWSLGDIPPMTNGNLSFRLTVSSNGVYSVNADVVYKRGITSVTNTHTLSVTNSTALMITLLSGSQVGVNFSGDTNRTYQLQASTNLSAWEILTSVTSTNGFFQFIDSHTNHRQRFYRVRTQ